ncbi:MULTISPECIES: FHA domain-containing protein [unclassified Nocardia]|uniref:FHA domain-containing protein n=1 Tax=unclassified Nocardia TaxID=2637762 RepID=UPI00278C3F1D|nr:MULTISPECIES: FHA domain-containing protein [unclassified Nocardia]
MDRQVEVVAGSHVLTRVAGAVILVAHRESGRLTSESRAAVAARALGDLVAEATEEAPDGPGRLVARQATRWLMKEAERISPGQSVDFGILSAADTGGVAVFLHGAVTAVLAGQSVEYYRGSDAAFTVDRVAEHPALAAALYIDDGRGRVPELPQRGVGSLVEGVAQAGGAVVWFEGEPLPVRRRAIPSHGVEFGGGGRHSAPEPGESPRGRHAAPPPTAAFDPITDRAVPEYDPDLTPTRTSTRLPAEFEVAEGVSPQSGAHTDPDSDAVGGHGSNASLGAGSQPVPRTGPAGAQSDSADTGDFDPHRAPTELGGTNPAPTPDPDLQRRLDATAKATALTVKVLGFRCARAHPSDPRSAFCSVCGMPVNQTQPLGEVIRPPLGMLLLDDGMTYMLTADAVVGRDPEQSEAARAGLVPLRVDDASGGMSRAHAEIRLVNWDVTVVDRGSTNGTRVRLPGYHDWVRLQPHQPMALTYGAEVLLGNRVLRLEPVAPPPFG